MKDIENLNDIQVFVYEFYDLVKEDQMLSPIFASRIADDDWGDHLKRMCDFWNTVLFFNKGIFLALLQIALNKESEKWL